MKTGTSHLRVAYSPEPPDEFDSDKPPMRRIAGQIRSLYPGYFALVMATGIISNAMLWSLVFPLGMYTLATYRLSLVTDFPPFLCVPRFMLWIAAATWFLTMTGMLSNMLRRARKASV